MTCYKIIKRKDKKNKIKQQLVKIYKIKPYKLVNGRMKPQGLNGFNASNGF